MTFYNMFSNFQITSTLLIIIMLTNTLKRLIFLARNTKKPSPQQPPLQKNDTQSNQVGYSHSISPTLKKIQKRYNESLKKQQQQEDELMKSFAQMQKTIFQQNQNRKKTKEQKERENEMQLKTLQIPEDLRQRFRKLNKQSSSTQNLKTSTKNNNQHSQSQENIFGDLDQLNLENSAKVYGKFIKSKQKADQIKNMIFGKQDPLAVEKLRQQVMIDQILKGSKAKQAKLNLPQDWKKQLEKKKKEKQEEEMILNEKVRYEKLKQLSNRQQDPKFRNKDIRSNTQLKKLDQLNEKYKIEISPDEIWRSKYSPDLIQAAMEYKNKELSYFKQLTEPENRDVWDDIRETTMLKPSKEQKERRRKDKELLDANKEKQHKKLGVTAEPVQEQGLTRYKDLEFYKQKGIKEFQQTQNVESYDIQLREAAKKDLNQINKLSDIFLDEFADPQQVRLQKKEIYEKSSFGKYEIKVKQLSRKMVSLGIEHDFEDLALLKKQQLFADKKMQEQNASYKQYLIKKEKKKYMKEELKKVHQQKLRQDLNYDYEIDPAKLEKLNPMQMEEGLKKMEEINKMKESTIISNQYLKEKIHHTKTLRNMTQFISAYFYNNFQNPNNTITQKIQVGNIIANKKNTVLNVFWQFHPNYVKLMEKYKFNEDDIQQQKKALQQKLQKQSTYISSKMTNYLGLRYGPDIRFYFNEILQQTQKSIEQMKRYKDEIIELTVEEYKQKGLIKTSEQQEEYRKKIESLATNSLQDINNQKKLISKIYQKKQRIKQKLETRKQEKKNKKQQQESPELKAKKKLSQKQLEELVLNKVITEKVQAKKESIFTPYIEDEQLYFGEQAPNSNHKKEKKNIEQRSVLQKKKKRSPVERLWEDIQKGI